MKQSSDIQTSFMAKVGDLLVRYSGWWIIAGLALTLLLIVPLIAMSPDEDASSNPGGEVFEVQEDLGDWFQTFVHRQAYVIEARGEDVLTQAVLWELYQNTQELLAADERGELAPPGLAAQSYLYPAFDTDTERSFVGLNTFADEVQRVLSGPEFSTALESASDDQIKLAVHLLLSDPGTAALRDALSVESRSEKKVAGGLEIDYWTSPALIVSVIADNQKLGGASEFGRSLGGDDRELDKEKFNRNVQEVLRGEERTYQAWGIAIDLNLESEDEGKTAAVFIMLTVVAAVIVVGVSLRSYWAMALTGAGLGALIIWLKGISNLVGLKGGLTIELIVPIAMIALGVDFAVHAIRRYQEETNLGYAPQRALQIGFAGVLGALGLAMLTDGIAFLSNVSSNIEAIIHFGIAAGISVASSFLMLGIIVPLAVMRIDQLRRPSTGATPIGGRILATVAGLNAAVLFAVSVLLLVVGLVIPGVAVFLVAVLTFLVAPVLIMRRKNRDAQLFTDFSTMGHTDSHQDQGPGLVATVVGDLARFRVIVLLVVIVVTAGAAMLAIRLDPEFDVKDFFDSNSDFVVSLDQLDKHIAGRGGEPGLIFVEGDLTDPEALTALHQFVGELARNPYVGRDSDGLPSLEDNVFDLLERITASAYARSQITQESGIEITDNDGDGVPDNQLQIRATYDYMVQNGVPLDESNFVYDAGQVRDRLFHIPGSSKDNVTLLVVGIPGTREQTVVKAVRESLMDDMEVLRQNPIFSRVGLTGSAFVREGQLDATTQSLRRALPISVAAALVLLIIMMRSLRYAVVTIIPVLLVAVWLYALMYLIGFSLNFVTATIGAISIGVGIDYSIHMTERFREELRRTDTPIEALRRAASGTGVALMASAVSSILGFVILGFAPMPLFSSFGFLTAIMIFLVLAASLVVLPSLLLFVTPDTAATGGSAVD